MKKLFTILFLFVSFIALSQNNGINFQGVGRNSSGAVLASTKISLRFSVIQSSETGTVEYVESKEVTTNAQGIFSVVIGDGTQISKTGNFSDINWKINPKFLKVEMDPAGGTSFVAMGTTRLQAVPFAYYANGVNADNVDGVLSASKGGTGVASIAALKTALAIDQINNTSDLAKPISTLTKEALDTKVSTSVFSTTIATKANTSDLALKAPNDSPTFTGTVAGITKAMVGLGSVNNTSDLAKPISTATQEALDTKVSISTFSTTVATKANTFDLATKAPIDSPTFTGTISGITKAMVGLGSVNNTSDLAKPISTATQEALDTKVSASTFSTTLATKVDTETFSSTVATKENAANKSTATDLGAGSTSDILFPTQKAVKTYVDAQINAGGVADGGITTNKLATSAVTDEKVASGINKAKVGLENVDNTSDLNKPLSTATILALADKPSIDVRRVAKLDEPNSFTGDQQISGNLSLSNGNLNLAGGTQIQSGTNSETTILNRPNSSLIISTTAISGNDTPTNNSWAFNPSGTLTFPNNSSIGSMDSELFIENLGGIYLNGGNKIENESGTWSEINISPSHNPGSVFILTTSEGGTVSQTTKIWEFGTGGFNNENNGFLTFPDGTGMGATNDVFSIESEKGIILGSGGDYDSRKRAEISISPKNLVDPDGNNIEPDDVETEGNIYLQTILFSNIEGINPLINIWKFDNNGVLRFPDGTTLAGNYSGSTDFEFKLIEDSGFKISTFENDEGDYVNHSWEFQSNGFLRFPDGSQMGDFQIEDYPEFFTPNFFISSRNGIFLFGGQTDQPYSKSGTIAISPNSWYDENSDNPDYDSEGNIYVQTQGFISNDINENESFTKTWKFDNNGALRFPDGTITSGSISGTSNFGFDTRATENGFSIITAGTSSATTQLWEYNTDGSLTFPDGTITSGSISGTNNFGFDTRATENGFSIITAGTSSGTSQLWEYNTDGSLTFPDGTITSGTISGTVNFGFDTRATENGFSILTGTSTGTSQLWTFDTNGVLNLPAGGDIKIGGASVLAGNSNLTMKYFKVSSQGYDLTNARNLTDGIDLTIWRFNLEHIPILNQVALYIKGTRLSPTNYTVSENVVILDINVWDSDPIGDYDIYIDYKY
jgi:hypothetical protein